jgi:hypothetical protein
MGQMGKSLFHGRIKLHQGTHAKGDGGRPLLN